MKFVALTVLVLALFAGQSSAQWQITNLAYPAGAAHFFVNQNTGSNITGNGSAASPWATITFAYNQMVAIIPVGPAVLNVDEGYYGPSTGEQFPLRMRPGKCISGRNANTTIVSLDGFVQSPACIFDFLAADGPFLTSDGPYLERLTLRNSLPSAVNVLLNLNSSNSAVRMAGNPGNCSLVSPTFEGLVVYGMGTVFLGDFVHPRIVDCTITLNEVGARNVGNTTNCCGDWEIVNTICIDNRIHDMWGITGAGVNHCNFDGSPPKVHPGFCPASAILPTVGVQGNVNVSPVGFVQPSPVSVLPGSLLQEEFDFRLAATSGVRGLGIATGAIWDAEGWANPRFGFDLARPVDIGADQFGHFRQTPLAHGTPLGGSIATTGLAGLDVRLVADGAPGSLAFVVFHDVFAFPVLQNPPFFPVIGASGVLWTNPLAGGTAFVGVIPAGAPLVVPFPVAAGAWPRLMMQFATFGVTADLTEAQDMPLVY